MNTMSNKCFILAGLLAVLCAIEVVRRLRKAQDVRFPILITVCSCTILLATGMVLTYMNK